MRRPLHEETMEMQGRGLVAQLVIDVHDDAVANVHDHRRQRPCPIDANDGPHEGAVRVGEYPGHIEVICDRRRLDGSRGGEQDRADRGIEAHGGSLLTNTVIPVQLSDSGVKLKKKVT